MSLITISIQIQIPYVSEQLSINAILKIVKVKGKLRLGKTSGAKAMEYMITTMTTGATNATGKHWDPSKQVHLNLVGYKPDKSCDLHNCIKQIADGVQRGMVEDGIKDDSDFHFHDIDPHYDPDHPDHKTILIYVWQEEGSLVQ